MSPSTGLPLRTLALLLIILFPLSKSGEIGVKGIEPNALMQEVTRQ
jgi:hypothetical protein